MQEIWFHIDKIQAAMKNMSIEERGMTVQAIAEAAARDDIKFLEQFDFVSIKEPAELPAPTTILILKPRSCLIRIKPAAH